MTDARPSHWTDPLPRYAVNYKGNRVPCCCTERELCLLHAWQRDGCQTVTSPQHTRKG